MNTIEDAVLKCIDYLEFDVPLPAIIANRARRFLINRRVPRCRPKVLAAAIVFHASFAEGRKK